MTYDAICHLFDLSSSTTNNRVWQKAEGKGTVVTKQANVLERERLGRLGRCLTGIDCVLLADRGERAKVPSEE